MNLPLPSSRGLAVRARRAMASGDPLGAALATVWALGSLTCIALLSLLVHENGAPNSLSLGPAASNADVSPKAAAAPQR